MRRPFLLCALVALAVMLTGGGLLAVRTSAQSATPAGGTTTLVLVEHNDAMTDVLQEESEGPAAGDLRVWGPNALYDESNTTDTGATSQGSCIALNAEFECLLNETILFADGSTLELQGIQLAGAQPSTRTIVGGSGQYLGATGTVSVAPTEDLLLWTKVIEITL
ncbi:MAG: dirigent protein [Chloroflexia bacterium]|nr:dirigent protein [Chloroflexia bacterium]